MTRRGLGLIAGSLLVAGAALAYQLADGAAPDRVGRPDLALLTSLPLVFGEQFGLDQPGSPALKRIEQDYVVQPIAIADAASLAGRRLLLMAHPRAQPAEVLVELDAWVRKGGRVMLLADPRLDWESSRPLGDALRPPPAFADTGLIGHWGLALEVDERGAGSFKLTGTQCLLAQAAFVARCRIGQGLATIIADADLIMETEGDGFDLMMAEIARLAEREPGHRDSPTNLSTSLSHKNKDGTEG